MRDGDLRGVFNALHAEESPDLTFTAADVVRAGERVRRRRRALAVAGSGVVTAAAVLAVVLLPGGRADVPAPLVPADPTTRLTTTTATPSQPMTSPPVINTSPGVFPPATSTSG
ncbi:hypothetical protein ACTG9Q_12980 [Actinokineospora sp. 24-640]